MARLSYIDQQIKDVADAQGISTQEAIAQVRKGSQEVDFDNLPSQNHLWTDRGAKMTCENAGHTMHEAWKIGK